MPKNEGFKRVMRLLQAAVRAEKQGLSDSELRSRLDQQADARFLSRREWLKKSAILGAALPLKEMIPDFRPLDRHLVRDIKAVYPDGLVRMPTYEHPGANAEITKKFDGISLHDYLYSKTDVDRWVLDAVEVLYVCEYGMD